MAKLKKIKKLKKTIRQFFDKDENRIIIESTDKRIGISIKLISEKKRRNIGYITKSTRTLFVKRERSKHLHWMSNSYGFNYHLIKEAKQFDLVSLSDEFSDYNIPRTYILENGKILFFKQQGFELQTFVTLNEMEQFKIPNKENRRF